MFFCGGGLQFSRIKWISLVLQDKGLSISSIHRYIMSVKLDLGFNKWEVVVSDSSGIQRQISRVFPASSVTRHNIKSKRWANSGVK